ncbi:hypothetical protein Aduo_002039 [Ancylostoma duodenale]
MREVNSSILLYQTMLSNSRILSMDDEVQQMFKCVMVISSSNADPERTFSTANRLTAGERNSLATTTINTMMQ